MQTTTDFDMLCAALDAGDDSVLPILADWLEEQGDSRAEGLRLEMPPMHHHGPDYWFGADAVVATYGRSLSLTVYPTRHDAFLALAEALSHER